MPDASGAFAAAGLGAGRRVACHALGGVFAGAFAMSANAPLRRRARLTRRALLLGSAPWAAAARALDDGRTAALPAGVVGIGAAIEAGFREAAAQAVRRTHAAGLPAATADGTERAMDDPARPPRRARARRVRAGGGVRAPE